MKFIGTIFLLILTSSIYSRDIIVSKMGSLENGDGSEAKPFKTIQEAANIAIAGDRIIIHKGVYNETVIPENSGTSDARIIYLPYNFDNVIIDGADTISNWTLHSGNIYRAYMPWDLGAENQMFVNDTMVHLARWPNVLNSNDPFFDFSSYSNCSKGSSNGKIIDNALPVNPDDFYKGCILWGNFGVKWTAFGTKVISSKGNTLIYTGGDSYHSPQATPWSSMLPTDRDMYFLSGKYELLDTCNEWFYDNVKDSLYIWIKQGSEHQVSIKAKHRMLAFNLDNKSYITIKNIQVFSSTITMNNSNYCVLDGVLARYITHHSMDGVKPYMLGYENLKNRCGIQFSGEKDSVINCVINYSAGSGITIGSGSNHVVDNNDIQYCNYANSYCEGINSENKSGNKVIITRNKIWYTGGPSVNYTKLQPNTSGNIILYNDCAFAEQLGDDRGGINGCSGVVAYNWVHNIGRGLGYGVTNGLYTDQSQDYVIYHHNVIWNLFPTSVPSIRINNTANPPDGNLGIFIYNNTGFGGSGNVMVQGQGQKTIIEKNDYCNPSPVNFSDSKNGDFRLTATATAIDKGVVISGITGGFYGSKPDLGAYEYGNIEGVSDWKAGNNVKMYYKWVDQDISNENIKVSSIRVYPNPASSILYFDNLESNTEVTILDCFGKVLLNKKLTNRELDVSGLKTGLFLLKIICNNKTEIQKIIKH